MDRNNIPIHSTLMAAYFSFHLAAGHAADDKPTPGHKVPEKKAGASMNKVDSILTSSPVNDGKSIESHEQVKKQETKLPQATSVCEEKPHLCR